MELDEPDFHWWMQMVAKCNKWKELIDQAGAYSEIRLGRGPFTLITPPPIKSIPNILKIITIFVDFNHSFVISHLSSFPLLLLSILKMSPLPPEFTSATREKGMPRWTWPWRTWRPTLAGRVGQEQSGLRVMNYLKRNQVGSPFLNTTGTSSHNPKSSFRKSKKCCPC